LPELRALRVPLVAGGLVALLTRLPHLWDRTLLDTDVYLTMGEQWLAHGALPYRDLFDHKGPFLFELFAAQTALLPDSLLAVHAALLAGFLVSVWQLAALARRRGGPATAWLAAVVYGLAGSSVVFEGPDPNADQWALAGLVAAVDLADRHAQDGRARWAAGSGAAVGLLVAIKLPHLAIVPLLVALVGVRGLPALAGGALAAGALTLLPFALAGALGDVRFALLEYSPGFVGDTLARRASAGWLLTFPGWPLLISGVGLAAVAWRAGHARRLVRIGLAWLVLGWVFARSSGEVYAHYFVVLTPPLALLAGAGLGALAPRRALPALVLCALVAVLAAGGWRDALEVPAQRRWMGTEQPQLAGIGAAAQLVQRITRPGDRVYVVSNFGRGGQIVYWLADRRPAHRLMFPSEMLPPRLDEVTADLTARPPAALVAIARTPLAPYRPVLAAGGLAEVGRFAGGVRVFARR
jgi:4-amino-4-deoxy-L-arabinose transferase-like glycosyltransferase